MRNIVRAASAVAALRKDPQLDSAIAGIDKTVPGARNVQRPLENVDNYSAHRRLWLFHRARLGERVLLEPSADRLVVYVGELAFDLDVVANAVRELAEAALEAIHRMADENART